MLRRFSRLPPLRLAAVVALLAVVWFTHVCLSANGDPFGPSVDGTLWVIASLLKLAALASLLQLLAHVHQAVFSFRWLAVRAFFVLSLGPTVAMMALACTRSWWAPVLSTDNSKFFDVGDSLPLGPSIETTRQAWVAAWTAGRVAVAELGLLWVLAGALVGTGYVLGRKPWLSVLVACVGVDVVLTVYLAWCPWFLADYDFFHGDIVAGALLLDQVGVWANDPYTTLALPIYAALAVGALIILRMAGSREDASA
jgi:hypothetical protein